MVANVAFTTLATGLLLRKHMFATPLSGRKFIVNPFVCPVYYLSRSVKASNNLQMLALHGPELYIFFNAITGQLEDQ